MSSNGQASSLPLLAHQNPPIVRHSNSSNANAMTSSQNENALEAQEPNIEKLLLKAPYPLLYPKLSQKELQTSLTDLVVYAKRLPVPTDQGIQGFFPTIDNFFFPDVGREEIRKSNLVDPKSTYDFIFDLTVCGLPKHLEEVVKQEVEKIENCDEERSKRAKKAIVVLLLAMRVARKTVGTSKAHGRSEKTLEVYRECQIVLDNAAYELLRFIPFSEFPSFCETDCLALLADDIGYKKRLIYLSLEAQAKVFLSHSYWDEFYNWKWNGETFCTKSKACICDCCEHRSSLSLQWKFRIQLIFMVIFAFTASLAVGSGILWEDMRTHFPQDNTEHIINFDHVCLVIVFALFVPSMIVYEFKEYDSVVKYMKFHRTKMAILIVWMVNLFIRCITCPWLMKWVDFTEYGYIYFNKFGTYALYITIAPYMVVHIGNAMNMQLVTRLMGKNLKQLSFFGLFFFTCSCFHSTLVYALRFSNDGGKDNHEHTVVWILFEAVAFEIFGEPSEAIREGTFPSTSKCKPELSSFTVVHRLFEELKNHTTTNMATAETNAIRKQLDEAISCNLRSTLMPIFLFLFLIIIVVILMNIVQAVITDYNEKLQENSAHYKALYRMRLLVHTERSCSAIFAAMNFIAALKRTAQHHTRRQVNDEDWFSCDCVIRLIVWALLFAGGSALLMTILTLVYERDNLFHKLSTTSAALTTDLPM